MVELPSAELHKTPLHALHLKLGAKMTAFAGYDMPVHYPAGILKEHLHTRAHAGLFDVSHMGQAVLHPRPGVDIAAAFESLTPGDIAGLSPGQMRYTQLLNERGGILDDLMVTRHWAKDKGNALFLVVNAGRKMEDFTHIEKALTGVAVLEPLPDRALLALQGPQAANVLARHIPQGAALKFMHGGSFAIASQEVIVHRCGYTGEDGFEISLPASAAQEWAVRLLAEPEVEPVGLGARDSLRLEAGLCLYGHDIDETTTPIEANLLWSIGKRRREAGGFPGAAIIQEQIRQGVSRLLVGVKPDGRAPAREGTEIQDQTGKKIGQITSGGFSPTLNAPIAMGYVSAAFAAPGTPLQLLVRGKLLPAHTVSLPFIPKRFHK
ncbi:MAG TPA: glycine cleavage system aminomethyltransferase GcvT [Alphaproteobacteria bacterium]|nr:glycine cleavage system aminomethyltransferase GcvT [Alphaproteobacteria bacterium]